MVKQPEQHMDRSSSQTPVSPPLTKQFSDTISTRHAHGPWPVYITSKDTHPFPLQFPPMHLHTHSALSAASESPSHFHAPAPPTALAAASAPGCTTPPATHRGVHKHTNTRCLHSSTCSNVRVALQELVKQPAQHLVRTRPSQPPVAPLLHIHIRLTRRQSDTHTHHRLGRSGYTSPHPLSPKD